MQGECKESAKECFELLCINFVAFWACFGVGLSKLGALWGRYRYVKVTFVYFGLTLVTWWSHFGYIKVGFQKIRIFLTDFNNFIEHPGYITISLGLLWGQVLAILGIEGVVWFTFGSFVDTFGRLGLHFEHPGLALL